MLNRLQYTNPNIEFVFSKDIFEYDISSAGYSILRKYKLVSDNDLHFLSLMDKENRNVYIGNLKYKYADVHTQINKYLLEELQDFIRRNNISDDDIISSKRDALFITRYSTSLKSDVVEFKEKNVYSSYIRLKGSNIELYCNKHGIDIKGIHDDTIHLHEDYMTSFIYTLVQMIESKNDKLSEFITRFITQYKAFELDVGFYREFNPRSQFIIKRADKYKSTFALDNKAFLSDEDKKYLEISYNFNHIILPLLNIVINL